MRPETSLLKLEATLYLMGTIAFELLCNSLTLEVNEGLWSQHGLVAQNFPCESYLCATENKVNKIHKHINLQFGKMHKKLLFASAERSWRREESISASIETLIGSESSLEAFIMILCICWTMVWNEFHKFKDTHQVAMDWIMVWSAKGGTQYTYSDSLTKWWCFHL